MMENNKFITLINSQKPSWSRIPWLPDFIGIFFSGYRLSWVINGLWLELWHSVRVQMLLKPYRTYCYHKLCHFCDQVVVYWCRLKTNSQDSQDCSTRSARLFRKCSMEKFFKQCLVETKFQQMGNSISGSVEVILSILHYLKSKICFICTFYSWIALFDIFKIWLFSEYFCRYCPNDQTQLHLVTGKLAIENELNLNTIRTCRLSSIDDTVSAYYLYEKLIFNLWTKYYQILDSKLQSSHSIWVFRK